MLLMNILRSITFRKEHVILVDTIPALKHELNSLNYFLNPAIDELSALWKGIKVNTHNSPFSPVKIQAAVSCFATDIPGARELCVFLGHSARQGCSQNFQVVLESRETMVVSWTGTSGKRDPHSITDKVPGNFLFY